jgi:hypothetical protein
MEARGRRGDGATGRYTAYQRAAWLLFTLTADRERTAWADVALALLVAVLIAGACAALWFWGGA